MAEESKEIQSKENSVSKQGSKKGETKIEPLQNIPAPNKVMQDATKGKTTGKKRKKIGFKLLIFLISLVNILILGSIFFMLAGTRDKAVELKSLRNAAIGAEEKGKVEVGDLEIESVIQKYEYLKKMFPDEVGLVEFVKAIEKIKAEGSIRDFSFANQDAVRDKTKVVGIPFVLRMVGSWDDIDRDLARLQELPYLTRAVTLDIRVVGDTEKLVDLKYGGFIYVNESLEKN